MRTEGTTPFFTRLFLQHLRIWSRNLMAGINSCDKKSWIRHFIMTLGAIEKFAPINEEGFDNLFVIKE